MAAVSTIRKSSMIPPSIADANSFVDAMRRAVTGVNIVTTDGPAGRFGLTVSAFSSVSAEPPTVLVCINKRSPARDAVLANGKFCVNLLSTDQRWLADTFAGRPASGAPYDFNCASWHSSITGSPVLDGAVASFDCEVDTALSSGSHTIFIGRALAVEDESAVPLIYTNRRYGNPNRWQ